MPCIQVVRLWPGGGDETHLDYDGILGPRSFDTVKPPGFNDDRAFAAAPVYSRNRRGLE